MMRVGRKLARGICAAAVLFTAGRLDSSVPDPAERALLLVRQQDFSAVFDLAADRLRGYFAPERQERFLAELFGLSGKWKAVTRSDASYYRYVRRSFEKQVLDPAEFLRVLERVREDYVYAVRAAENRLLGLILEDLRTSRPSLTLPEVRLEYARLAEELAPQVLGDLGMNVVSVAGSEAAAAALTAALASSGILGAGAASGAASGPWTLGIGLAAGLGAGFAIDALVGDACEDAARHRLRAGVNEVRLRAIDDVTGALARALGAHLRMQEDCIRRLYHGRRSHAHPARRA
jgi:hypothetical protein